MAERPAAKPEIASQKRAIKLTPALGDWTTYKPPKILVKKVKSGLYGFDRLSKDDLNIVLQIHYRFILDLLRHLKMNLGMGIEFYACQVEQTNYLNFLRTVENSIVQGKISAANIHEGIQIFIGLDAAHSIINHAVGSRDLETISRGLTEAENSIFSTALCDFIPRLNIPFENVLENPLFSIIGSPDAVPDLSINSSSTFVTFSAETSLNDNPPAKIAFGYLASSLKLLLKAYREKTKDKPLNFGSLDPRILGKIKIPVRTVLGKTILASSELRSLESGDVVSIDTPINNAVMVSIGKAIRLKAQPGIFEKKRAARIASFKEDENVSFAPPLVPEPAEKIEPTVAPPPTEHPQEKDAAVSQEKPIEAPEEDFLDEDFEEDDLSLEEEKEEPIEDFEEEDFLSEEEENTGGL